MTPAGRDDEGHLTFRSDGGTLPGLCHCALNEAHYADPAEDHSEADAKWSEPEREFAERWYGTEEGRAWVATEWPEGWPEP